MILVIASELDAAARVAVEGWDGGDAILTTPSDVSSAGWSVSTGRIREARLVASGRQVAASSIAGIVNLVPAIGEHELFDIERDSRSYVAAEATAFLLFLLTVMPCKVVNRPTSERLNGPNWRPEQWARACFTVGIDAAPIRRDSKARADVPSAAGHLTSVSLLAGRVIGRTALGCVEPVRRLAELAGTCFLRANFVEHDGRHLFHSVELAPDLTDQAVRTALTRYFLEG